MSYIGIKGASRLDPANMLDFKHAELLDSKACVPLEIKIRTGWEKGKDGLWRYEIPDPFIETHAVEDYVKPRFGEAISITMILKDTQILVAYPEFEDLTLYVMYSPRRGTAGYYNPATNGMVVSMGKPSDDYSYQIDGVLLHEIQHLIQEIEGFAKGGSPQNIGIRKYRRLAGEVEARNICYRHFMSEEERRHTLRIQTQDIPDEQQIVTFK